MNKFIRTISIFILPFLFLTVLQYYLDPYNILKQEKNEKLLKVKIQTAAKINYPLYKLQEYYHDPTDIIILGDSRANKFDRKTFEKLTNEKVTNLAYGGGTIPEIIETFLVVNKMHKLKKVYIGINFNLYNALNNQDRVKEANSIRSSILSYLSSKYCVKSTFLILKSLLTGEKVELEKPPLSRDEFWDFQLKNAGPNFYRNYVYPAQFNKNLIGISEYCRNHNIELIIFIPPTHIDLQNKIIEYGLEKENEQFKLDLAALGTPVIDFNFENTITQDKEYFIDPFHFDRNFMPILINVISSDSSQDSLSNHLYKSLGSIRK